MSIVYNTLPVAAQGAADLERAAREAPPSPTSVLTTVCDEIARMR